MKIAQEVSKEKLRGCYYTGDAIVDACYDVLATTIDRRDNLSFLEPSAGDGAFVAGLQRAIKRGLFKSAQITCVEVNDAEAAKCRERLGSTNVSGSVSAASFFQWFNGNTGQFDALMGNPPYVRYQFVPESDRFLAEAALASFGFELHGVSNFWIPFVLLSFESLRPGGAFAFVLPSELLATHSASGVRKALVSKFEDLSMHFFPQGSFPGALHEVLVAPSDTFVREGTDSVARFFTAQDFRSALCN